MKYDRTVNRYSGWVADGFARYRDHKATLAALELAQRLLDYQPTHEFTYQHKAQLLLQSLKDNRIGPEHVLCRVAELYAYMEDNPAALPSQRQEDFALARLLIHLVKWGNATGERARPGAHVLALLGSMAREMLYPWACAFVRKLRSDDEARAALQRQSADFR